MRKSFAILTLFLTLALLSGCSKLVMNLKSRFTTGEEQIQAAFAAKQKAKSWKMTTRLAVHDEKVMETTFEISCPDRERITASVAGEKKEMVRVGSKFYVNQDGKWYWVDVKDSTWSPCGQGSGEPSPWAMLNEGRDMVTMFATTKGRFVFTRGDIHEVEGKPCQQWNVDLANAEKLGAAGLGYRVCIGADSRPVWVIMGKGGLVSRYTDWDKPIDIPEPLNAQVWVEPKQPPMPAMPMPDFKKLPPGHPAPKPPGHPGM